MRFQETCYSCGAAGIVNALKFYGINVPERVTRPRSRTTEASGTSEDNVMVGLRSFGLSCSSLSNNGFADAYDSLLDSLLSGRPVLLCVDKLQHWILAMGLCGRRVVAFDPTRTVKNKAEHGVTVMTRRQLARRWHAYVGGTDLYYGVQVSKR